MKHTSRTSVAGIVILAAVFSLAGCGSAAPDVRLADLTDVPGAEAETTSTPEATAPGDDTEADDADSESGSRDLTFAAGQSLSPSRTPQLGDPFMADPGWVVKSYDDGQGSWSYTTADTLCTLIFKQQTVAGGAVTIFEGDDKATTDSYLAYLIDATKEDVGIKAETGTFSYAMDDTAVVESRVIHGTFADGNDWMIAARAFTQPMAGLYVYVSCAPDADSAAVFADVVDNVSIITSLG